MTMLLRTLVIAAAVATFIDMAMAANYLVGAPNGGWDLNTPLQAWANAQKFVAGDTLSKYSIINLEMSAKHLFCNLH